MSLKHTVKSLICLMQHIEQKRRRLELLLQLLQKPVVAEEIFGEVQRTVKECEEEGVWLKQQIEQESRKLKLLLQPVIKLHRADVTLLPVCEEEPVSPEQQEASINLVQINPETPQIELELDEPLQKPGEAGGATVTLLAVNSEDHENIDTEPVAGTSTEHSKLRQTDVADRGEYDITEDSDEWVSATSHFSESEITEESDDRVSLSATSSHCSECDTEDSDDWEETSKGQSTLNTLKSHNKTYHVEGQRSSLSSKLSPPLLRSSKRTPSTKSHTENNGFRCTICGNGFGCKGNLNRHMRIHKGEKPYGCTVCKQRFTRKEHLKRHMRIHTGEKPYGCTVCKQRFTRKSYLNTHMRRTHTGYGGDEEKRKRMDSSSKLP